MRLPIAPNGKVAAQGVLSDDRRRPRHHRFTPPTPQPPQTTNTITAQWDRQGSAIQPYAYSMSVFQGFDPTNAGNATYRSHIQQLNPPIVRYHNDGMVLDSSTQYGWVRNSNIPSYRWDRQKIRSAITGAYQGRSRCITIPKWPAAIKEASGKLIPSKIGEFAAWCADLIRIINIENRAGFTHVLLLNELDDLYSTDMATLAQIWIAAHDAIRAIDPTIKIGGPGFITIYKPQVQTFLSICHASMDFVSCHAYAALSPATADNKRSWLSAATSMRSTTQAARTAINRVTTRQIPIWLTEAGPYWENSYIPERTTAVRLIWETLLMMSTATGAAEMVGSWCESDTWFGLMDNQFGGFNLRPAAYAYTLFNNFCRGQSYPVTIAGATYLTNNTEVSEVAGFATRRDESRSIVLVNRCEADRVVSIVNQGWQPINSGKLFRVSAGGITSVEIFPNQLNAIAMPRDSIAIVVW